MVRTQTKAPGLANEAVAPDQRQTNQPNTFRGWILDAGAATDPGFVQFRDHALAQLRIDHKLCTEAEYVLEHTVESLAAFGEQGVFGNFKDIALKQHDRFLVEKFRYHLYCSVNLRRLGVGPIVGDVDTIDLQSVFALRSLDLWRGINAFSYVLNTQREATWRTVGLGHPKSLFQEVDDALVRWAISARRIDALHSYRERPTFVPATENVERQLTELGLSNATFYTGTFTPDDLRSPKTVAAAAQAFTGAVDPARERVSASNPELSHRTRYLRRRLYRASMLFDYLQPGEDLWQCGWMGETFETRPGGLFSNASRASPQTMKELADRLAPPPSKAELALFEQLIRNAQSSPPADVVAFVRDANRVLDAANLRIRVKEGLARLAVKRNSIQFMVAGPGTLGLKNRDFQVVHVPQKYGKLPGSRKGQSPSPEI